jgi:hypothetical protein
LRRCRQVYHRIAIHVLPLLILRSQEQLEHFADLVQEIDRHGPFPESVVITANLSKAKCTIEQLDLFIKAKILRNVDGASRPRRASWLRHKSEIRKIHDTLKGYRENILAAMSASAL